MVSYEIFEGYEVEAADNSGPFQEERPIEEEAKEVATLLLSTQLSCHSAGIGQRQVAQGRCQVTQAQEDSLTCQGFSSISGL